MIITLNTVSPYGHSWFIMFVADGLSPILRQDICNNHSDKDLPTPWKMMMKKILPWQVGPNKYIYGLRSIITGQQYGFCHIRQSSLETWFHLLIRLTISSHSFHLSLAVKPGAIQPAASLHVSRTPGPGGKWGHSPTQAQESTSLSLLGFPLQVFPVAGTPKQ